MSRLAQRAHAPLVFVALAAGLVATGPAQAQRTSDGATSRARSAVAPAHERTGDLAGMATELTGILAQSATDAPATQALIQLGALAAEHGFSWLAPHEDAFKVAIGAIELGGEDANASFRALDNRERLLGFIARLGERRGDFDQRDASLASRGSVRSWLLCGPFGFTARALHDRAYGPERLQARSDRSLEETFEGRYGDVTWQRIGLQAYQETVWPNSVQSLGEGAAYALTEVRGAPGQTVLCSIESAGSFKAWWNDEPVVDVDRQDAFEPRTFRVRVTLGDGVQRLLIKSSQPRAGFTVRIVDEQGHPVAAGLESGLAALGTHKALERAANRDVPGDATALAGVALEALAERLAPAALTAIEQAIAKSPKDAALYRHLATVLSASEHLPDAERRHRRRQALQEAAKLDPEDLATAVEATQFLVEDGKQAAAYRALEALAAKSKHPYIAVRAAHQLAITESWDTEVSRGLERIRALCPDAAWPLRDLAAHYDLLGNAGRAYDLYEASLDMNAASIGALTNLAGLERKAGRYDQAEARLRAALEAWPEHDGLVRSLSRVLEESGNGEGAADLLEGTQAYGWRSSPFDRLRVGDACLLAAAHKERDGALEAAVALGARARRAYEEALEFMPARFDLRNHLHAASSDPGQDKSPEAALLAYVTGLRIDTQEALEGAPAPAEFPKAHSVGVLDHMVTWVHQDGTQTEWVHQLHEIRDSKGVQQHHTTQVGGEILRLRTLATDGKIYEPLVTDSTRDIILPKLEPGARIEVEYRMERRRKPAFQMDLGPFFFRDPELTTPYWQSRWDLVVPKGLDVRWVERNMVEADALHEETELAGGYVHHRYETRRMDRFEPEAFMPTRDELTPWVRVLGERTLSDVAEVLSERFAGRAKLTPQLEQAAADAVASAADPTQLAQAKALFAFVQSHVKTSQGRAFRASEILAEGTGSRTILLKALLDAAGIPNRYGFARRHPSLAPPVVWSPPRPELFDVPLLAIEPEGAERVFFFDLGRYVPFGHMPYALGGGSGLLLSQEGGELITLPAVPLSGEGQLTRTALTLLEKGATVRVDTIVKNGYGAKENLETVPKDMVKLSLEQQAASLFFQPKITEVDLPGLTEIGQPLHLRYTAQVPRAVEPAGEGAFELKLPFQPLQLSRQLLGPSEREHPLVLRAAQLQEDEVSIDLGPYAMAGVPGDVLVRGEFGFYALLFRAEGETLHITRRFVIEPSQIAPQDYAALRDQLQTIDAAERARIRLRRR